MCKTFEAIHKISKKLRNEGKGGERIAVILDHFKVMGDIACCDDEKCCCFEDLLTLKNAVVMCAKDPEKKREVEWINIPTYHIIAFTFSHCDCGE